MPANEAVLEPPSAAPTTAKPDMFGTDSGGDPFTQWDEGATKPVAEPKTEKTAPKDKSAGTTPPKQPAKEPDKTPDRAPEGTAKPPDSPQDKPEDVPPEKMAPKALREAYAKLKEDLKAREVKHKGELETFKKSSAAPREDPEKTQLVAKYSDLEKRHKDLESEIRYLDYEKSPEFKEKHYTPYVEKCQNAVASVQELKVAQADGTSRVATADDLWKIVEIPNTEDALSAAEELFGSATKANFVVNLRNEIRQANNTMQKAKAEFRKTGEARMQEFQKQSEAQHRQLAESWQTLNERAIEKYPQWFKADETDEKGKEILSKGFELADLAFSGRTDIPQEKMLALHSAVRNQAAGFRYAVHKWESAAARVTELEKELAQFKSSKPGPGEVAGDKRGGDEMDDPFARFET